MTGLVLVGTISSGHMFWQQLQGWRVLPCIGLAVLFVAGTLYCVIASAARNAEVGVGKALEIVSSNEQRHRLESEITLAQQDARKAKAAASKDCATGEGPVCRSLTKLATQADSHYWLLVGRLASSKPEQSANPGLQHAARVFAIFVHADPATIARGLELVAPFLKAIFLEVATVVFFGIGLGHSILAKNASNGNHPATGNEMETVGRVDRFVSVSRTVFRKQPRQPRQLAIAERAPFEDLRPPSLDDAETVVNALRPLYRPVNNDEQPGIMGVTKGEASRRATVAFEKGLIIRQRLGRHVAISLKPPN